MLDPGSLSWLLLPLGVVFGWALATRTRGRGHEHMPTDRESASGMLLEDLSDDAVSAIVQAAGQQPALAELQLTLGSLFRRRGEVDRAIGIHQSLLSNASLSRELRNGAQYELARDYQKAGLMDRAEDLLTQLIDAGVHTAPILEALLAMHEQARDWNLAIAVAERLQSVQARDFGKVLANYHCELAEQALALQKQAEARQFARRALELNPSSVRASLMLGSMAERNGDAVGALRAYRRVPDQDPRFIPEVVVPLERCAEAIGHPEMFAEFVDEAEQRYPLSGAIMQIRARLIRKRGGDASAYLMSRLAQHPHWGGLLAWIEAQGGNRAGEPDLAMLRETLRKRLAERPGYRCTQCGLAAGLLFWQCPSCRSWDTIIPEEDLP